VTLRLHLASGNAHKAGEFAALARAAGAPVEIVRPPRMPPVLEDTGTFLGNARKKAAALQAELPARSWVLADDSGLLVDALGGAPGVESAYFAGPEGDFAANLRKLREVMVAVPDGQRQACFYCLLLAAGPAGEEHVFEGRCEGMIAREPAGADGFGYDPIFVPAGHACTYAQLSPAEKNRISHRGQAWAALVSWARQREAG